MNDETRFTNHVRNVLDESVDGLDGATRSRLAQARNAALERKTRHVRWLPLGALSAGLAAAVVLVAVMLWPSATVQAPAITDMALLESDEPLEFYEDMEFYQWLLESENAEDLSGSGAGLPGAVAMGDAGLGPGQRDLALAGDAEHGDAGLSRDV